MSLSDPRLNDACLCLIDGGFVDEAKLLSVMPDVLVALADLHGALGEFHVLNAARAEKIEALREVELARGWRTASGPSHVPRGATDDESSS